MFALVDANNFYVSCERAFQPELNNKPTIVLSNNDGCAIARSNEVKALKIPMGEAIHKIHSQVQLHGIQIRSANFTLYGDMSSRFMSVIEKHSPNIEVYSVDEAFVNIGTYRDTGTWAEQLRANLYQHIGLPSSIGVARTKVLAKLANRLAKKSSGTFIIRPVDEQKVLSVTPVGDLWGIGRRISERLMKMGIYTAWQLARANTRLMRKTFSVVMSRIQDELNGKPVMELELETESRQQIVVSRSFGETVTDKRQLQLAITKFVEEGSRKLRKQDSEARLLSVALNTNPYSSRDKQYHRSCDLKLPYSTSNSRCINHYAQLLIDKLYKQDYHYKRAGIVLMNLTQAGDHQADLFNAAPDNELDKAKDKINERFGRMMLKPASLITDKQNWKMKRNFLSRQFTTNWMHLPEVN